MLLIGQRILETKPFHSEISAGFLTSLKTKTICICPKVKISILSKVLAHKVDAPTYIGMIYRYIIQK